MRRIAVALLILLKTSTDKLNAETAAKTATLKAQAQMAEKAYDKERTDNANYQRDNPVQPVRLCLSAGSSGIVPKAGAANPGNANTGATAAILQPVPAGDPSGGAGNVGPDISGMLSALSAKADDVSSTLREYQHRVL